MANVGTSSQAAMAAAYEIANQYVLHEPAIRGSLVAAMAEVIDRHAQTTE